MVSVSKDVVMFVGSSHFNKGKTAIRLTEATVSQKFLISKIFGWLKLGESMTIHQIFPVPKFPSLQYAMWQFFICQFVASSYATSVM